MQNVWIQQTCCLKQLNLIEITISKKPSSWMLLLCIYMNAIYIQRKMECSVRKKKKMNLRIYYEWNKMETSKYLMKHERKKKHHLSCQTELLNCENSASVQRTNHTIGRLKSQTTSPVQLQKQRLANIVFPCMFLPLIHNCRLNFLRFRFALNSIAILVCSLNVQR